MPKIEASLKAIIAFWREHRAQNLHQRKLPGLVTDWHRVRLLTLQAAYMLLTRAIINRSAEKMEHPTISCDPAFLEPVMEWVDTASDRTLLEVLQASKDDRLFICFLALYIEHADMGQELARRVEPYRFTVELIRTQWGGEEGRVKEVERLFTDGTKQYALGLPERFQKDPANQEADFHQESWLRLLEWWEEERGELMRRERNARNEKLEWFNTIPLLPHEQAFFDGPIQTAWRVALPHVRADFNVLLKARTFPYKLRLKREAAVEKIERRQPFLRPDEYELDGMDEDAEPRSRYDEQIASNWQCAERNL